MAEHDEHPKCGADTEIVCGDQVINEHHVSHKQCHGAETSDAHSHTHHENEAHDGHHHSHGGHSHSHVGADTSISRLAIALGITVVILIVQVIGGILANSLALLADSGHLLVDSAGIVIALVAARLAKRPRSDTYTWGWARAEVISAAFQAGMLLVVCGFILVEAVERLTTVQPLNPELMIWFASVGFIGNMLSMLVLLGVRSNNLNLRAAFLEVATDSFSSLAVIIGGILAATTGYHFFDPLISLIIGCVMAPRAYFLLRHTVRVLMESTPAELNLSDVRQHIINLDHVIDVHDLHVSTIATNQVALSAHVTLSDECFNSGHSLQTLHAIQECLAEHFPIVIEHSTIQLDTERHRDHETLQHPA